MRFVLIALAAVVVAPASTIPAAVAAETEGSRVIVPFSTVVGDPCTGEPVAVEGTLVILSRTTVSETGGLSSSIWLLRMR